MQILHLVPSTLPGGLRLLLGSATDPDVCVCTLGDGATLPALGVRREALGWTRALDPRPLWRLARLVRRLQPRVVHVWGLPALRALRLATAARRVGPVVVNRPRWQGPAPNAMDRWLLHGVNRILVRGPADAARWQAAGIP